eukprot:4177798-Lingulodinium_polyedra.AAC.1
MPPTARPSARPFSSSGSLAQPTPASTPARACTTSFLDDAVTMSSSASQTSPPGFPRRSGHGTDAWRPRLALPPRLT